MDPKSQYKNVLENVYRGLRLCNPDYVRAVHNERKFTPSIIKKILITLAEQNIILVGSIESDHKPCLNGLIEEMGMYKESCCHENHSNLKSLKQKSNRIEIFHMSHGHKWSNWFKLYRVCTIIQCHTCSCKYY